MIFSNTLFTGKKNSASVELQCRVIIVLERNERGLHLRQPNVGGEMLGAVNPLQLSTLACSSSHGAAGLSPAAFG